MKVYLIAILFSAAIIFIALGIHNENFIFGCIGGFFAGIYNAMVHKQD